MSAVKWQKRSDAPSVGSFFTEAFGGSTGGFCVKGKMLLTS
jgi:hypothetical protein